MLSVISICPWLNFTFDVLVFGIWTLLFPFDFKSIWLQNYKTDNRGGGAVGKSVHLSSGRLGVGILAATDLSRKNRYWQLHCQSLGNRCECHGSSERTIKDRHSRCGTLKNPHCSVAMSAKYRSKFAALKRQWWRLHLSEKFSSGMKNKQTKQTLLFITYFSWGAESNF